jgi:hypothetical protein
MSTRNAFKDMKMSWRIIFIVAGLVGYCCNGFAAEATATGSSEKMDESVLRIEGFERSWNETFHGITSFIGYKGKFWGWTVEGDALT